jgi:hypothetical protein
MGTVGESLILVFVFIPVPDTELLIPWDYISNRSVFFFNEATLGGFLGGGWSPEGPD